MGLTAGANGPRNLHFIVSWVSASGVRFPGQHVHLSTRRAYRPPVRSIGVGSNVYAAEVLPRPQNRQQELWRIAKTLSRRK